MKTSGRGGTAIGMAAAAFLVMPQAWAHAFPEREEPGVGTELHDVPKKVQIWFNVELEPAFSSVVVKDKTGKDVSAGSRVDPQSQHRLEANLRPLSPGEYHVFWRVVATDGHSTEGDYTFTVEP